MTIAVCAWHPRYFGRCRLLGIRWRPWWRVLLSHGMCLRCSARLLHDAD